MPNRMDEKPFLVFDLLDIDRTMVPEIQKLSKADFDLESVVSAAEELKYISGLRKVIAAEAKDPSDEWIRFFVNRLYEGRTTQKVIDQFRPLVTRALNQYIGDQVQGRLKTALDDDGQPMVAAVQPGVAAAPVVEVPATAPAAGTPVMSDIQTTDEELEGFNIVRAIAAAEVSPDRVVHRDGKAYFAILLDDNNRKPLIRLHLNSKNKKFVTTFESGKDGTRRDIDSVVDIYRAAGEAIKATIRQYEAGKVQAESV
jgi:hypothetical protein